MTVPVDNEVALQRRYYEETASKYEDMHDVNAGEHAFALSFMLAAIDHHGWDSVLDIGSGTGRAVACLRGSRPRLRVVGIEPVEALRKVGHAQGLAESELIDGDATDLEYPDGAFDLVCEFAVLHHVREPELVVGEMLRVARRAIFISDSNNFGQGGPLKRTLKQMLGVVGLWKAADFLATRGKGFHFSEGDGVSYSYSVFNSHRQIRRACPRVHVLNVTGSGVNPYRTAGHVAVLGVKGAV